MTGPARRRQAPGSRRLPPRSGSEAVWVPWRQLLLLSQRWSGSSALSRSSVKETRTLIVLAGVAVGRRCVSGGGRARRCSRRRPSTGSCRRRPSTPSSSADVRRGCRQRLVDLRCAADGRLARGSPGWVRPSTTSVASLVRVSSLSASSVKDTLHLDGLALVGVDQRVGGVRLSG